ncbi:MAG: hypothetical protein M3Q91_08845 [Acidobacteriota bacterium]|jgi:hypothetical protein|nr:hypothetical protein [Acidobacteriota bacterium]
MKNLKDMFVKFTLSAMLLTLVGSTVNNFAAPVVRTASGANAAAIQATVDQFRNDLGPLNPNVAQTFPTGRREINWDGVPDALSSPNNLPANFFNTNSPRGAVFTSPCSNGLFRVSSTAASGTPVRFGEIDASYTDSFTTFSAQRLFTVISVFPNSCNILTINFFIPGAPTPATVSGFGVVFTDVDLTGNARIICFNAAGGLLGGGILAPAAAPGGLSFIGVSFNEGERISQCQITSGTTGLAPGHFNGRNGADVVAMDDFIYGEPQPIQTLAIFDGDGVSDK